MNVAIKKLHEDSKIPSYAHGTDAGMDLYYYGEDVVLDAGARGVFATGIAVAIPRLYVGLIWDKSGIATKEGLKVLGGVVDAGYRGEVMVALLNTSNIPVTISTGRKLAQMLIQPVCHPHIDVVDGELPAAEDERGEGGFGSTGLN